MLASTYKIKKALISKGLFGCECKKNYCFLFSDSLEFFFKGSNDELFNTSSLGAVFIPSSFSYFISKFQGYSDTELFFRLFFFLSHFLTSISSIHLYLPFYINKFLVSFLENFKYYFLDSKNKKTRKLAKEGFS